MKLQLIYLLIAQISISSTILTDSPAANRLSKSSGGTCKQPQAKSYLKRFSAPSELKSQGSDIGMGCDSVSTQDFPKPSNKDDIGTNVALNAAQIAKEAYDAQMEAGKAAADAVKQNLANKAAQAAQSAAAALAGKQQVVEELKKRTEAAVEVTKKQSQILEKTQLSLVKITATLKEAQQNLEELQSAVDITSKDLENWNAILSGVKDDYAQRHEKTEELKVALEALEQRYKEAQADLNKSKQTANKAVQGSQQINDNARRFKRSSQ